MILSVRLFVAAIAAIGSLGPICAKAAPLFTVVHEMGPEIESATEALLAGEDLALGFRCYAGNLTLANMTSPPMMRPVFLIPRIITSTHGGDSESDGKNDINGRGKKDDASFYIFYIFLVGAFVSVVILNSLEAGAS